MFSFDQINRFQSRRTPFYYYDVELLKSTLSILSTLQKKKNVKIHYAIKANANMPILGKISEYGLGADCVSGNEIQQALSSGFNPSDIVFAGVGKSDEELELGLVHNISCFNVESVHELIIINEIGERHGKVVPVAFRINPDYDAGTHKNITTGTRYDKFGIPESDIPELPGLVKNMKNICFKGLHFHIGSQITNMSVFRELAVRINDIQSFFTSHGLHPSIINVGGGLGVNYAQPENEMVPDFSTYINTYLNVLKRQPDQEIHFELGRSVVAHCGSLITRVLFLKRTGDLTFAVIDAGMNDLMRPALYQATHKVQSLSGIGKEKVYAIVGPICESSDVFGKDILLPQLERGDLLAIRTTGAYGESMSSGYNLRKSAQAVYSSKMHVGKIHPQVANKIL